MFQDFAGRPRAGGPRTGSIRRRETTRIVPLPRLPEVTAFPLKAGGGNVQRLIVAVGHEQVPRCPALVKCRLRFRLGKAGIPHRRLVQIQTGAQGVRRLDANHYRASDARHTGHRRLADAGAHQRGMRLLVGTRAQLRKAHLPEIAPVVQILPRPRRHQQRLRLIQPGDAVRHRDAETQIFVMVIGGTAPGAHNQAPVAQIVQQRRLHRQPHRMMKSQFHHRKADFDAAGAGGHGGPQHQRVGVRRRAVKMMLGEPHRMHPDLLGQQDLLQGAVNNGGILFGVVADRKDERTEPHFGLAARCCGMA